VNAARALAPWNYAFQFPNPPQGVRGPLISADALKLAVGTLVSLGAAAFAVFGRDLLGRRQLVSGGAPPQGPEQQHGAEEHEPQRPEPIDLHRGVVLANEEVEPEPDQEQPDDPGPAS
jgi:hypothetical protein